MTTSELIDVLAKVEFGASGRPREISLKIDDILFSDCSFSINSTGDGVAGAELNLDVTYKEKYD